MSLEPVHSGKEMGEEGLKETPSQGDDVELDREKNYDLPDGWTKKVVRRMSGRTGETGRSWDVYLIPPTKGRRLRSMVDLMKYIQSNPTVPVDARFVNTERPAEVRGHAAKNGLSANVIKLMEFIEKVKNGEKVDINDFVGRSRNSNTKSPVAKSVKPVKKEVARSIDKSLVSSPPPIPVKTSTETQSTRIFQERIGRNQPQAGSFHPPPVAGVIEALSQRPQSSFPFTLPQMIKIEILIANCSVPPSPDEISEWSHCLGVRYSDLQEWIRWKWISNHPNFGQDLGVDSSVDDSIDSDLVPLSFCDVVMAADD